MAYEKRACAYSYVVALTSENWVDISTGISTTTQRGLIIGHFDPDLMRTYQKPYRGRFVRHLVYHRVEAKEVGKVKTTYWYTKFLVLVKSAVSTS